MAHERRANRLIDETSPYLLQHAHNPVEWYPWGEEALQRAKSEDKPILLSIGYAACHWCHVMERESFEDPATAALMNQSFICIKVDREERPDIDAIYMDAVQIMTGHGGWPMTMFLTPQGEPFYGGTYFPPDDRHGLPAFRRVLEGVAEAWKERRGEVESQGRQLVAHLETIGRVVPSSELLDSTPIREAVAKLSGSYDPRNGGFGGPPKFPQAPVLEFMLRRAAAGESQAREMVLHTLERMALGGIYDQIGGGFHRYSVDERWLVPHFEKMLYDNAQLARVYVHAWQLTKNPLYRRIAVESLDYLLRDMRDPGGAFYSSEDADSEGEEGKFYVWSFEEFSRLASGAESYYGVELEGNFEGQNILTASGSDPPEDARRKLFESRSTRVRPARDEKVLTSWNGLAIAAMAEAGAALGEPRFAKASGEAAEFFLQNAAEEDRLFHSYRNGTAKVTGLLEDYAYLAEGLFVLWEATFEPRWIERCREITSAMLELFGDPSDGGLYSTASDHERLIIRQKELVESATPSPMGTAALLVQKLAVLTGDQGLATKGAEMVRMARDYMEKAPQAVPSFLSALDFWVSTPKEIVIVSPENPAENELFEQAWGSLIPNRVMAGAPPGIESPMLDGKTSVDGKPTAYVCENYACRAPTSDPQELAAQLQ